MISAGLLASFVILGIASFAAAAPAIATPRDTVQGAVGRVLLILRDNRLNRPEAGEGIGRTMAVDRRAEIRRIAFELFDFDEVARRALGRHWTARTPAERTEFVRLFTELLETTYIDKIDTYLESKMTFVGETVDGAHATVRSRVMAPAPRSAQTTVDYQTHLKGGRWKVYDIVIDGVSFVSNYRSQIERIVKNSSYASLIALLRRTTNPGTPVLASPRTAPR